MITRTFKEFLKLSGPDITKSRMLSREERLTRYMPPVVAEMLERRRLMALTVSIDSGTVEIDGTSGADSISVFIGSSPDTLLQVSDGLGGTYTKYDPGVVSLVKILAGGSNDSIYISRSGANAVQEVCLIYGEAGNDYIEAGNLADTIYGGAGLNTMLAFAGNDIVYGEGGNDNVSGGADNDSIWGDAGNDVLNGNEGNDLIYGYSDADTLDGGDGNDSLYGEDGDDVITGGQNPDTMYGGDGNDTFFADDNYTDSIFGGAGTDSATNRNVGNDVLVDVEIS